MKAALLAAALCLTMPPVVAALVDNGSCPAGQVQEIRGGNVVKHIARNYRCVPRPK